MKYFRFLIPVICLISLSPAYGQFGLKLGANMSAAGSYGNSEEGETANLKFGYQGGVFYNFDLSEKLDLLVELNYEARGTISKKDYTIGLPVVDPSSGTVLGIGDYTINQEINSTQSYINIPVLVVLGNTKFKYYFGPNFGFYVGGQAEFERSIDVSLGGNVVNQINSNIEDVDWNDYDSFKNIFTNPPSENGNFLNSFDFGLKIGAMYYMTESLFLDLRVNQGLADVTNNHYDNSIYPASDFSFPSREDIDRNFSLQLGVGFSF